MQNRLRSTLEGAFTCGIFLVFMFLALYTPFGAIMLFIFSVPFTVYAARHELRKAVIVVVASSLLAFVLGSLPGVFNAFFAGFLGIVMGACYRFQKKAVVVFLAGTLANLVTFLGSLLISYYIFGINPIHSSQELLKQSLQLSESIAGRLGSIDEKQITMLRGMIDILPKILPTLFIIGSAFMALVNHGISRKILQRLGVMVSPFPPFRDWQWPRSILFYYLIVVILFNSKWLDKDGGFLYLAILNLYPLFDLILLLSGLSFIFFYAYKKQWGKGIPILAIILVFIFPSFQYILTLLGVFDLGFNLKTRVNGKS